MPEIKVHRSPEDRIRDGEDIATFEDLEGLPVDKLREIAEQCDIEPSDPDACVSCKAFEIWWEVANAEEKGEVESLDIPLPEGAVAGAMEPEEQDALVAHIAERLAAAPLPDVEILMGAAGDPVVVPDPFQEPPAPQVYGPSALLMQIRASMSALNASVEELLEQPPSQPNATELAALIVGAQRWIDSLDARLNEGFTLRPEQMEIKTYTEQVIARLRSAS